jgi:hypothetical protein
MSLRLLCRSVPCVAALLALAGCGDSTGPCGGGGNSLCGSASNVYKLVFEKVECFRMDQAGTPNAYIVQYVDKVGNMPVKIVVNAPVVQGEEKDLVKTGGTIKHTMPSASEFPDMKEGKIFFDGLGAIGGACNGRFYITFVNTGSTLDGTFETSLKLLSAP